MASSKTTKAFKIESRDVILALFLPAFFGLILGSVFANSDAEIFGKPKGLIFSGSNGLKFLLGQLLWPICATIWTASLSSVFAIVAKHSCLLSSQFRPSLQQDNQPQLVEKICEAADANCEPETNSDYEEARTHRKLKSLGKELTLSSKEDLENVRHPTKHDIDGGFKIRQSRDPRFQSLAASLGNYYTSLDHQSFHMHSGVIEGKDDSQKSMLFPYDYLYSHSNNGYKNNHHKYSQLNQYGQNITLTDKEEIRLSRYGELREADEATYSLTSSVENEVDTDDEDEQSHHQKELELMTAAVGESFEYVLATGVNVNREECREEVVVWSAGDKVRAVVTTDSKEEISPSSLDTPTSLSITSNNYNKKHMSDTEESSFG
ncbi:uncharacterized protein LOC142345339 isoform X4 [Convolutriloba macropyga]